MVKIDSVEPLNDAQFIKPIRINYTQNNIKKTWEAVVSHDSVAILLYHTQKKAFVLVKQLRVTVLNSNKKQGDTYELCAGIIDKDIPDIQIAKEEILEECGYNIALDSIKKITSYYTSVGISGARQTFYFAKCDESMKVNNGGGLEDEDIEVVYLPLDQAKEFIFDENFQKTPGLIMAFYWFFDNTELIQTL